MKSLLVRALLLLALAGMIVGAAGCETWKGMGRDVENVGDKMQGDNK